MIDFELISFNANLSKRYNISDITKENIEKAFTIRRLFKI